MTDFANAFLSGDLSQRFLAKPFHDAQVRTSQVTLASKRSMPQELATLVIEQNSKLPQTPERAKALQALTSGNIAFVITGQQTGLFTGPLLTLYKTLSAVALAAQLEDATGVRTIPLFWLQSEDHDFDEINQCLLPSATGGHHSIRLAHRMSTAKSSVQYENISETREAALAELRTVLESLPHGRAVYDIIEAAYRNNDSIVSAFATALAALLRKESLLFFSPRDIRFARLVVPLYRKTILEQENISAILVCRENELRDAGFASQVHVRPDSPLCFFHPQSESAPRYRLERAQSAWRIVGTEQNVTEQELLETLDKHPLQFSTSALLRPIVQEYFFPSAGYVGGLAEVNYFAQIDPLFDFFSIPRPVIYPRASFRCLESKDRRLLEKLSLSATAATLLQELSESLNKSGDAATFDEITSLLKSNFGTLVEELRRVDPTLVGPTQKTEDKLFQQLASLRDKYKGAILRTKTIEQERVHWLREQLFPSDIEQERILSPLYFLAKYGFDFIATVKAALDPLHPAMREIHL